MLDTLPEPEGADGVLGGGAATGDSSSALERVELPPAVAAISQPTEVVIQTSDGKIHTISLPSGTVRTVELGSATPGGYGDLVTSPDAVFVGGYGFDPVIVPRSGPPRFLDTDQFGQADNAGQLQVDATGWFRTTDGSTAFSVSVYDDAGVGPSEYVVAVDGTVTAAAVSSIMSDVRAVADNGDRYVNDAGGAYRVAVDGTTTRVSNGTIMAGSAGYLMMRECDEARVCDYVIASNSDPAGPDRRIVDNPHVAELIATSYVQSLSPDGTAISIQRNDGSTVIVDVELGEVTTGTTNYGYGALWAADSSGAFTWDERGLAFLDRSSGDELRFGDEFGQIMFIGVRSPESELVEQTVALDDLTFSAQPAGPIGLDLVTIGKIGGMTLLDLDDAIATTWNAPAVTGRPPRLFSDGEQVVVVAANSNTGYIASFGTARPLAEDEVPQAPLLTGQEPGAIWAHNPAGTSTIDQITVNPFGGTSSLAQVMLSNGELLGSDSAGGMVVSSGGDIYTTSGGSVTKLTSGELIAMGTATAYVRECDERLFCTTIRVDRTSGERSAVESESLIDFATGVDFARVVSLEGSVSPDGAVALVEISTSDSVDPAAEPATEWSLIDFASGLSIPIPEPLEGQPTIWNADSSYAAIATEDAIVLYERATASIIEVSGTEGARCIVAVDASFPTVSD
jgi:hypothetical protein